MSDSRRSLASRAAEEPLLRVRLPRVRRPVIDGGGGRCAKGSPLAPEGPALPGPGQACDLPLHERGASHVDTFDYKPKLATDNGKPSDRPGRIPGAKLMGSPWKFSQHGQSGLWISELFPEVAAHADELCVIRSMHTDLPAHPEAYLMLHTGSSQFIRPSLGAWTLYGLGTESDDLPGFIAIKPTGRNGGAAELRQRVPAGGLPGDPDRQRGPADRRGPGRQHQEPPARPPGPAAASSTSCSR